MRVRICAVALVALLGSTAAFAQGPTQGPGPGGQMYGPMMTGPMMDQRMMGPMMGPGSMMMNPAQHIDGRLAFLKAELKITDAQMPQWNAFADALRTNAGRMGSMWNTMVGTMGPGRMTAPGSMSGQAGAPLALPERLDLMEQHMTAHLEMIRAIKGPAMQLYTVLSDDQKRVANTLIHGPMGMM